jgi:hypothetical protein
VTNRPNFKGRNLASSHNYTAEKKLLHKLRARKSYDLPAKFAAGRNGSA